MANPHQAFTITSITRGQIAIELNEFLKVECGQEPHFEEGDPRLTDAICEEYADNLCELDSQYTGDRECDGYVDALFDVHAKLLRQLGIKVEIDGYSAAD